MVKSKGIKYVSLIVASILLVSVLASPISYLKFKLNQGFIAQTLCINKSKPALKCNGHCYYAQKMQNEVQKAAKTKQLLENLPVFTLFSNPDIEISFHNKGNFLFAVKHLSKVKSINSQSYFFAVFHPPLG